MRDPRLVEIDFLMDLEREERMTVLGHGEKRRDKYAGAGARTGKGNPVQVYGTDPRRFRDMAHGLLMENLITGVTNDGSVDSPNEMRSGIPFPLIPGVEFLVQLTHAGRVHLWNMRDALLRDPDLEPFGLRSRAAWDRDLFVKLRWASPEEPLSVVLFDLDNFGKVNKDYGLPVGDAVLRLVFQFTKIVVGTRGTVYRYGGEEVGVLLPSIALEEAKGIADEVRSLIEREIHMQVEILKAPQTASIGVASFIASVENDVAVAKVDSLMRAAKQGGKNRVEVGT